MKVENTYTSIGCNPTTHSLDWGDFDAILFAAGNAIAWANPSIFNSDKRSTKIVKTFVGHTDRVTTVKWIRRCHYGHISYEFISGSDDGTAIVWSIDGNGNVEMQQLSDHTGGITVVSSIVVHKMSKFPTVIIATASSDCTAKLWHRVNGKFQCFQTIQLNGLCFDIALTELLNSSILIAFATDDNKIYLYGERLNVYEQVECLTGHEDWVRGLSFISTGKNITYLASASQDTFVRIWKISPTYDEILGSDNSTEATKLSNDSILDDVIKIEDRIFTIEISDSGAFKYSIALESVLSGHEGWLFSVDWHLSDSGKLQLLTSSIDKTIIVWTPGYDGIWLESVRVGEIGGNSLGFYGAKFDPSGRSIVAHGYQGSLHLWHNSVEDENLWQPGVPVGGHFGPAVDLCWAPDGQFLFTVSRDQTTRIHAPWLTDNISKIDAEDWHEIARPQVHGYDMQCIAALSQYRIASAAEEKIVRTFEAPANFVENLQRICNVQSSELTSIRNKPSGASVPSLGLSNKAVYDTNTPIVTHVKDEYPENYFVPITLDAPPTEETLMQNTLWPEVQKLYGHGYEIYSMCVSNDGKLLASACKASNPKYTTIIIWSTKSWKILLNLQSEHMLTITQMKFSPDDQYLLTVSRDRRWSIFRKCVIIEDNVNNHNMNDDDDYNLTSLHFSIKKMPKKQEIHRRIIWSCDWSFDSKYFVTGSRDGKCVLWSMNLENLRDIEEEKTDEFNTLVNVDTVDVLELKNESITAVAFLQKLLPNSDCHLIAIGLENGTIHFYRFDVKKQKLELEFTLNNQWAHNKTVRKLQFRPCSDDIYLASCGEDNLVRIYKIVV